MEIRRLSAQDPDEVTRASHLFDGPSDEAAVRRFLGEVGHHLLIAYLDGHPAGLESGVEMTHPDKGTF